MTARKWSGVSEDGLVPDVLICLWDLEPS